MGKPVSEIPSKLFYKIGEVCEITDTQPYVLRFWESEFPQLAPRKNRSGQRVYQRKDIETVLQIKKLLYEEEYTIAGARKKLEDEPSVQAGGKPAPPATPAGKPLRRAGARRRGAEKDHPVDLLTSVASASGDRAVTRRLERLEKALGEVKISLEEVLKLLGTGV